MSNVNLDAADLDSTDEGLYGERQLSNIVALGGGSGLPVVLTALRRHLPPEGRITAVVTAADDGGSSGILRAQYGVLPPGDIRNCLLALAQVAPEVSAALQYRFNGATGPGHPVGNLLLTALDLVAADEVAAIRLAAGLLGVRDAVLPSTTERVHLVAEFPDGRQVRGESRIRRRGAPIARLRLDSPQARPAPGVLEALQTADAVILGPGSLYTSVLAALVVPGMVEAVAAVRGARIFICNLMTQPGETDGYTARQHMEIVKRYSPEIQFDFVIVNNRPISKEQTGRYAAEGASQIGIANDDLAETTLDGESEIVRADLLDEGDKVRHNPERLARVAIACWEQARTRPVVVV